MPAAASTPRPILALIGLRCAGKTSLGRLLAARFGVPFLDLDEALCERARAAGHAVDHAGDALLSLGEQRFRELEAQALVAALAGPVPGVLATGGGVVERAANRELLARDALCIWLSAPLTVLARRLELAPALRPALTGGDASAELATLELRRAPWYRALGSLRLDSDRHDLEECVTRVDAALEVDPTSGFGLRAGPG